MDKQGNKTGGRQKGTPNKKTKELLELMGDFSPLESLLSVVKSDRTPIDLKSKICLDLLGYIYPQTQIR